MDSELLFRLAHKSYRDDRIDIDRFKTRLELCMGRMTAVLASRHETPKPSSYSRATNPSICASTADTGWVVLYASDPAFLADGRGWRVIGAIGITKTGGKNMEPGTKVIIRQNPYHPGAVNIVISLQPGEGFGGVDLVDVRYKHPKNGERHSMPLNRFCLESATPAALNEMAECYEAIALELRKLAEQFA